MKKTLLTYFISKLHLLFAALLVSVCLQANAQSLDFGSGNNNSNNGGYSFGGKGAYGWDAAESTCEKKECNNATCQLTLGNDGHLSNNCPSGKRYDVDPNCVMNKNAKASTCMDTMPVSSINRVAETNCFRANGAGSNPKPRNHLGTDYAAVEGTPVTAAADGTIVFANLMSGAGRTILMEHEKKCPCSTQGCDNKFSTVYMHLKSFAATGGSVKKGTVIGYVGGSNYQNGQLCDYGHGTDKCHPYGPHLHFEIHSGGFGGKTGESARAVYSANLKGSIINPLCDDIQSFCGGCSNKVEEECTGKTNTSEWTTLDADAAESKVVNNPPPGISTNPEGEGMSSYDNTTCDYHNFMLDEDECLFCPLFRVLFNTASTLAQKTYNALKDALANVVIIVFALWIAWYVLKQVSALEVKKPSKMIQEILVQAFRVLFVVLVLKVSYGQILKLTIDPVFNTGMKYVQTVTGSGECPATASYMQDIKGYEDQLKPDSVGALPVSMGQNIVCSIKSLQDSVWRIVAFGRECRCVGWKIKYYIKWILPNFSYVFTGDFLIIAGLILLLAFPWCLVDCVLNMAVAAALLPAAIAAWAFKITSGYLKTLFDFFLNAMFNFVFVGIILYIIITVVNQFLMVVDQYSTEYDKLIDPIYGLAFWSVNGLKLLMVCLLGWVFLKKGKQIANEFAKAPSLDIGQKTGGLFAQMAKRAAVGSKGKDGKQHGGLLGIAKGGKEIVGLTVVDPIGSHIRQGIGSARNKWIMNNKHTTKTTDADGNTVYELDRNIFGMHNIFNTKRRVTVDADGNNVYSKEREKIGAQLQNKARGKLNNIRVGLIESADSKTEDLFETEIKDNQILKTSADGKSKSIYDENGDLIASKKIDENGHTILETERGQSVYDEDGNLLSANKSYRNLFGQKKNISVQKNADGNFDIKRTTTSRRMEILEHVSKDGSNLQNFAQNHSMKRERDLSSRVGTTASVSKDHLLSVRQIKNGKSEVIQEDYAFNTKFVKYLVQRNSTIDTAMVEQLQRETKLRPEQINTAIAEQVLKDRKIKLDSKFLDRNTSYEDGVLTIVQNNLDGSTTHLTTQIIGNQMLIDMEIVNKGEATHIIDNGVVNRVITKHKDKDPTTHYAFADRVVQNSSTSNLMNYNGEFGRFAPSINKDAAMLGLNEHDLELFATQENEKTDQQYDGHFDPQDRSDKINTYREALIYRRQAEQKAAQDLRELNKTKQELESLQSSLTSQNTAQMQGKMNMLEQKLRQAQTSYDSAMNEYNRWRGRENQARSNLQH